MAADDRFHKDQITAEIRKTHKAGRPAEEEAEWMLTKEYILDKSGGISSEIISMRRELHRLAETGGEAKRTGEYIRAKLTELEIPFEQDHETNSLLACIDTGREGPSIGLRADMDALPMPEEPRNLRFPRTCMSDTPGSTCHACGHDAHMAMLLGTAMIIVKDQDRFRGKFWLAFEDGEENGRGWPSMERLLEGKQIDTFWGIHVWSGLESATICVQAGPRMAGAIGTDITFIGRGGHGSRPDQAVNPVFVAANYLNNLAVAWANRIDANETVTLGITGIKGGEANNVIPDKASLLGSCRYFSEKEAEKAVEILRSVAEHTAAMHNATVEFGRNFGILGGALINDSHFSEIAETELKELLGAEAVVRSEPWFAGDSFHRYLNRYPGVMAHLGIRNEEKGTGAAHHNSFFDVDEDVLKTGVAATLGYIKAVTEDSVAD